MSVYHQAILNSLPDATRETKTAKAYLFDYNQTVQGQYLWGFLYNPSSLEFSRGAKYSESQTLSSRAADLQYGYSSGKTLSINEIVLDSWLQGKTIQPLLDGIEKLLECDINKKQYSPPILAFVFGSRRFSPCVLSNVKWVETGWLGGAPARATMSLTLQEVPPPLTRDALEGKKRVTQSRFADQKQKQGMPRMTLTERQQQEASVKSKEILQKNVSRFNTEVQSLIKSSAYRLSTNRETGDVMIFDRKGATVGLLGRYDGKGLTVTGISNLLK